MEYRFLPARVAGVTGILFFIGIAVPGFAAGGPPDPSDPAAKFLVYYQDHRSAIILAGLLAVLGTFFALFFFGKLINTLRRAEGDIGALTVTSIVSIGIVATLATVGGLISITTAFRVGGAEHVDAVTVLTLNDASNIAFALVGAPLAAFFAALGLLMVGTKQLPDWLGIVTLVAAALEVIGSLSVLGTTGFFSPGGAAPLLFSLLPLGVFVLATSIVMLTRPDRFDRVGPARAS